MKLIYTIVKTAGFHKWNEAANFLSNKHRHLFHFKVTLIVTDSNREVEFFFLQKVMQAKISRLGEEVQYGIDFGSKSCEHLARELFILLKQEKLNVYEVEVSEDGESGSIYRKDMNNNEIVFGS